MFGAGGHNIDPGCINAAVTQDIRQLCNILLNAVESTGKELPQIVGKDLGRIYIRRMTQPFHLRPYIAAVQRFAVFCYEDSETAEDIRKFIRTIPLSEPQAGPRGTYVCFNLPLLGYLSNYPWWVELD